MRHFLFASAFVVGMLYTESAVASEAEDFHEYYRYFQGKWIFVDSGKETVVECEDRVTYNYCHAGKAIELWGYDSVKKAWSGYGFGGNARWQWVLDRPEGEAITAGLRGGAVGTMWLADGTKISMKDDVVFIDNDNFEIVRTTQVEGQEEITEKTIRARRVH